MVRLGYFDLGLKEGVFCFIMRFDPQKSMVGCSMMFSKIPRSLRREEVSKIAEFVRISMRRL